MVRVLTIADGHGTLHREDFLYALKGDKPDLIFFLGDNFNFDLDVAMDYIDKHDMGYIPKYGIVGNHEYKKILDQYPIQNIHLQTVSFPVNPQRAIIIGGFSGSIKYKDEGDDYALFTNDQSVSLLNNFAKTDLFICHSNPCFKKPKHIDAHSGLLGIGKYIEKNTPVMTIHGHEHIRKTDYKRIRRGLFFNKLCCIRSCYKVECFYIDI